MIWLETLKIVNFHVTGMGMTLISSGREINIGLVSLVRRYLTARSVLMMIEMIRLCKRLCNLHRTHSFTDNLRKGMRVGSRTRELIGRRRE
jgi:ubiquinone biosynthesis protein Coq4